MTQPGATPAAQPPQPVSEAEPVDQPPEGPAVAVDGDAKDDREEPQQTLLEQMGGVSGLVYSSVPVLAFVAVFLPSHDLSAAIWSSVGSAVAILVWRLIRRESVQPAISGIFGVAVAAFIAYRTGSARGYFLFGIWTSLAYGAAFLLSVLARWPLAGVVWSALNGTGMGWRSDRLGRRYYDVATGVWVLVFGARFVVQHWLYVADQVGWLGVARIAMGWPLTAVAALVTIWAVRKADQRQKAMAEAAEPEPLPDPGA